eukprot:4470615-Amphidinium_carterae.2
MELSQIQSGLQCMIDVMHGLILIMLYVFVWVLPKPKSLDVSCRQLQLAFTKLHAVLTISLHGEDCGRVPCTHVLTKRRRLSVPCASRVTKHAAETGKHFERTSAKERTSHSMIGNVSNCKTVTDTSGCDQVLGGAQLVAALLVKGQADVNFLICAAIGCGFDATHFDIAQT